MDREITSRELHDDTTSVLRRVVAGERFMVTVEGRPVAELRPIQRSRRRWIDGVELAQRLRRSQADAGLRDDLARLAGDTTEDLGAIS